ncbi:MAG: YncE family protein [Acidimicrobiia bacterium]
MGRDSLTSPDIVEQGRSGGDRGMKGEADKASRAPSARRRAAVRAVSVSAVVVIVGVALAAFADRGHTRIVTAPQAPAVPAVPLDDVTLPVGTPPAILALSPDTGVVALLNSATGVPVRVLATHPLARGLVLQGAALTPDGRNAYYSLVGGCGEGSVYRVRTDRRSTPHRIGSGISPAVSPDGHWLAFAAPGRLRPDGTPGCHNVVVVHDLRSGEEVRRIRFPDDEEHRSGFFADAAFTRLSWAPDSRRLAVTHSYEGDSVSVLDTVAARDLTETAEVVVPGGGGDSRHPAWQAATGRLAVVNSAFSCCYDDDYTGPPRTLAMDVENRTAVDLLPEGMVPTWLDFDPTGEHLLYADGGSLYRRSRGGEPALVAPGFTIADW